MSCTRRFWTRGIAAAALVAALWTASAAMAQVRINEVVMEVKDTPSSSPLAGDGGKEFIELYNPSEAAIDISGWGIRYTSNLMTNAQNGYQLPGGSSIPAGGYFVIHRTGDTFTLPGGVPFATFAGNAANSELLPDSGSVSNGNGISIALTGADLTTVQDAVALEVYTNLTAGSAATKQASLATNGETAATGGGYWGAAFTLINNTPQANTDHDADYTPYSFSRWRDGASTGSTGRDFGFLPVTPGASNHVPISAAHVVPDVDALTANHPFVQEYNHVFIGARAIDPTVASAFNTSPSAQPSPQGGKAIVAWDQTGGGNAIYSKDIVRSFDIDVYLDTTLNQASTAEQEWEHTVYGIGTTDGWFNSPNPLGTIDTSGTPAVTNPATHSANGSTGIGWLFERHQDVGAANRTATLALVDFGDGGESKENAQWNVLEQISLAPGDTGWHRLSITYDETTGDVTAIFGDDEFEKTISTGRYGQFYVGYRVALTSTANAAPPIFDMRAPEQEDDADFDADGDVDGADFLTWQRNVGPGGGTALANGNANNDGAVDGADLAIWELQHPTATAASAPVPEPATWAMAVCALLAALAVARPSRALARVRA